MSARSVLNLACLLVLLGVMFLVGFWTGTGDAKTKIQTPAGCSIAASDTAAHLQQMLDIKGQTGITLSTVRQDIRALKQCGDK